MNSPQRKTAAVFLDPFITRACGRPATGRMADLCGNAAGRAVRGACGDADKRGDEFAGGSVYAGKEKQARRCTGCAAKREQRPAPVYAGRSAGDERGGGARKLRCDTGIHAPGFCRRGPGAAQP